MRKADNLPPSCAVVTKSGDLNFLEPSGPVQACNGTAMPFFYLLEFLLQFTGLCESRSDCTAALIINLGHRWKNLDSITLRPLYPGKESSVSTELTAGWAPEPVWTV